MNFRQVATAFVATGTPFGLFMELIFGFQFGEHQLNGCAGFRLADYGWG
jgi:hypothetical protein